MSPRQPNDTIFSHSIGSNDTIYYNCTIDFEGRIYPNRTICAYSKDTIYSKQETWKNFGVLVGWKQGEEWLSYEKVMNQLSELENRKNGVLPLLLYTRLVGVGNMMEAKDFVEITLRNDSYYNEIQRVLGAAAFVYVGGGFQVRMDDPAALSGRLWMIYSLVESLVTYQL